MRTKSAHWTFLRYVARKRYGQVHFGFDIKKWSHVWSISNTITIYNTFRLHSLYVSGIFERIWYEEWCNSIPTRSQYSLRELLVSFLEEVTNLKHFGIRLTRDCGNNVFYLASQILGCFMWLMKSFCPIYLSFSDGQKLCLHRRWFIYLWFIMFF